MLAAKASKFAFGVILGNSNCRSWAVLGCRNPVLALNALGSLHSHMKCSMLTRTPPLLHSKACLSYCCQMFTTVPSLPAAFLQWSAAPSRPVRSVLAMAGRCSWPRTCVLPSSTPVWAFRIVPLQQTVPEVCKNIANRELSNDGRARRS